MLFCAQSLKIFFLLDACYRLGQKAVAQMSKFKFNGIAKIKVVEADSLKATDYSTRIFQNSGFLLSPYINLDVDDLPIGRTVTKHRNQSPFFNEDFQIKSIQKNSPRKQMIKN